MSGGIAVDVAGNAYVTGSTGSPDFPTTPGAFQTKFGPNIDAFVTKLNPTGSALVYSTFLGGANDDFAYGIALAPAGSAYVMGSAGSPDFPTTAGAFNTTHNGAKEPFVTGLNPTGSALVYSTFLGGSSFAGGGIAVDTAGNAYVTGETLLGGFPVTPDAFQTVFNVTGLRDAFMTKVNPTGSALVYSTFLGGTGNDFGNGIAVDAAGNVYVTGRTNSGNFPVTAGAFQPALAGTASDAFVAKITTIVSVPFAAFDPKVTITLGPLANDDEFAIKATLTLRASTNGINPLTEPVTIRVGSFSVTIPGGSFSRKNPRKFREFMFVGIIEGVSLNAKINQLDPFMYEFKATGIGVDLTGTVNPVTVGLTIGDDQGSAAVTAVIQ